MKTAMWLICELGSVSPAPEQAQITPSTWPSLTPPTRRATLLHYEVPVNGARDILMLQPGIGR